MNINRIESRGRCTRSLFRRLEDGQATCSAKKQTEFVPLLRLPVEASTLAQSGWPRCDFSDAIRYGLAVIDMSNNTPGTCDIKETKSPACMEMIGRSNPELLLGET
jgi:hypothetical protein